MLEKYRSLFIHRDDVFAVQHESGNYYPERRELTDDDLTEHLAGLWSIGSYVIRPEDQTIKFLCFDLDTHDEETTDALCGLVQRMVSLNLSHEYIAGHGLPMLLLESSGSKGVHVWLFFSEPINAARVRRWVASEFLPQWTEETGGASLEIFPKQDTVAEGGFGNLVKLPLGQHAVSGKFSEIVGYQEWADSIESVQPLDVALVPDPPPVERTGSQSRGHRTGSEPASPFPCVDQILYRGAQRGGRDQAMFHLALYCYGHAVPEDLAKEMCARANEHFDPPIPDADIDRKIRQAYSGRYESATCGSDWLRNFCEGPCRAGWTVAKEPDAGRLRSASEGSLVEVQISQRTVEEGRTRLTIRHPDARNTPTLICE